MWANRIVGVLTDITGVIVLPIQLVSTALLGCLVSMTFGLFSIPMTIIWMGFFLGPLLGTSWLWTHAWPLRPVLAIIGIPWAVLAHIFVSLSPSMGEMDARIDKLIMCESWPYSFDFMRALSGKDMNPELERVLDRLTGRNPAVRSHLSRIQ